MSRTACLPFPSLDALPCWRPRTLWHVGCLDQPPHSRAMSYEGPGLSVSRCPAAWTAIAKLGGRTTYRLTRTDGTPGTFLAMHRVTADQRAIFRAWAVAAGWLTPTIYATAAWWDDELEDTLCVTLDTVEAALAEVHDLDLDAPTIRRAVAVAEQRLAAGARRARLPLPADASHTVTLRRAWAPSATLRAWWAETFTTPIPPVLAEDTAWMRWVGEGTLLDGLYWSDRLDPVQLSAPRAVIVPMALASWTVTPRPPARIAPGARRRPPPPLAHAEPSLPTGCATCSLRSSRSRPPPTRTRSPPGCANISTSP